MSSQAVFQIWAIAALAVAALLRFVAQPLVAGWLLRLKVRELEREFVATVPSGRRNDYRIAVQLMDFRAHPVDAAKKFLTGHAPLKRKPVNALDAGLCTQLLHAVEGYLLDTAVLPRARRRIEAAFDAVQIATPPAPPVVIPVEVRLPEPEPEPEPAGHR